MMGINLNQLIQGTLPHMSRVLENLGNNVGRLCMAVERLNQNLEGDESMATSVLNVNEQKVAEVFNSVNRKSKEESKSDWAKRRDTLFEFCTSRYGEDVTVVQAWKNLSDPAEMTYYEEYVEQNK